MYSQFIAKVLLEFQKDYLNNSNEVKIMRSMIWHPEEKDSKVNEYLEHANHAPYPAIAGLLAVGFCALTIVFLFAMV